MRNAISICVTTGRRLELILPVTLTKEVIVLKFSTDVVRKVENFLAVEPFIVYRSPASAMPLPMP